MSKAKFQPARVARYIKSGTQPAHFPVLQVPEFCFIGRSNAGKSTLLNRLVGRRRLAHTSRTPGRTQAVHFFDIDGRLAFVDLPGWGYAAVPRAQRKQFEPMVRRYVTTRANLCAAVLVVDIRREPGSEELDFVDLVTQRERMVLLAVSKVDKLGRHERRQRLGALAAAFDVPAEALFPYSGLTGEGCAEIRSTIDELARAFGRRHPLRPRTGGDG